MSTRILYMSDEFCKGTCIPLIHEIEKLDSESHEDIFIFVSSYGGCVASCLALIDACQRAKSDIVTIGMGKIMSAGAFTTVLAGTVGKRYAMPNTRIMLHEARGFAELSKVGMEPLRLANEMLIENIVSYTGKSMSEIESVLERDTYMSSSEAVEAGWIDHVSGAQFGLAM